MQCSSKKTPEQRSQPYEGTGRFFALMVASIVQAIQDGTLWAARVPDVGKRGGDGHALLQVRTDRKAKVKSIQDMQKASSKEGAKYEGNKDSDGVLKSSG